LNGADDTKGVILQDFNRRLIHLEECGSTKVNELEVTVVTHEKVIDRLSSLYEKGVFTVIVLTFISGANAIMNLVEFLKTIFK
jgi:hypothetical protein